jgi:hypothetical protein
MLGRVIATPETDKENPFRVLLSSFNGLREFSSAIKSGGAWVPKEAIPLSYLVSI